LFVVNGSAEQPAPAVYSLGAVYPNQAASAHFRLRNTSSAAATVTVLSVAGAGFTLNGPALPAALNPQAAVDFTVTFLSPDAGSYSAPLQSGGTSVLLLATVLPRLTYEVDTGAGLQPLGTGPVDFGSVNRGSSAVRHLVAVNRMAVVLIVPAISVPTSDFALSGVAPSGTVLQPGQSAAFDMRFSPTAAGSRSGSLVIGDQTYALIGTGVEPPPPPPPQPQLTYEVDAGAGLQPLGASPVDFGSVELGFGVARHFAVANQTTVVLTVPAIAVPAGDFVLSGAAPGGLALQPGKSADFYVQFTPTAAGVRTGSLVIGGSTYALTGTGVAPPPPPSLPSPGLSISLPQALSAQQGAVTVTLDATSATSGSGTLTLDFQPGPGLADDAAIAFASGGRTATFTVSPGDTQGHFGDQLTAPFQTGTTAGALVFTVQLGGVTAQQTITILPTSVGITLAQGVRSAAGVEVRVTGFDNTRTAGPLTFTFFDAAGNAVAPGAIHADAAPGFASYFQNSGLGGVFLLTADFPVTGDPSQVGAFQVQIANSAGTAPTARTAF
jgi:hypothetical protein